MEDPQRRALQFATTISTYEYQYRVYHKSSEVEVVGKKARSTCKMLRRTTEDQDFGIDFRVAAFLWAVQPCHRYTLDTVRCFTKRSIILQHVDRKNS